MNLDLMLYARHRRRTRRSAWAPTPTPARVDDAIARRRWRR